MRIGIDVQSITGSPSGIGYYTSNLLCSLKSVDSENEYILLKNKFFLGNLSTPKRLVWEQFVLPLEVYSQKIDLLHITGFSPPLLRKCKLVVTVHDLIGIRMPENNLSVYSRFYWCRYLPNMVKTADVIITDSNYSKKDIVELLKVPEQKIKVVYLAAGKEFRPITDKQKIKDILKKYGIDDHPYVLYVGNIEFRKNLNVLLDVWEKFKIQHKLVIAGSETKFTKNLSKAIVEKKLEDQVILTGYIQAIDLVSLYNAASIFVYPSLYEGFGLPVLEAMSCGTPVITSNVTSLPEIAGEAGIMVNPTNAEELHNAISTLLTNETLRKELREKGLARAKMFSWEKTAKETLQIYKTV